MSVLSDLKQLSAAEEFFDYLNVSYDPAVLSVSRLHVLRLIGNWLRNTELESQGDDAVRDAFADHLTTAYASLSEEGPLEQRLFKVHQDAVRESTGGGSTFVPLSAITRS